MMEFSNQGRYVSYERAVGNVIFRSAQDDIFFFDMLWPMLAVKAYCL